MASYNRKLLLICVPLVLLLVVAIWAIRKSQEPRADFDPNASSPDIHEGTGTDTDLPNDQLRNSITDLFLKHPIEEADHPLDPALQVARKGLAHIRSEVQDYTATVVKQERIKGELLEEEFFECKIRHPSREDEGADTPLSFYLKFINPKRVAGREVIWVEGQNDGKLIAHEGGGILGMVRASLDPNDRIAMVGNLHPITELGMETLIVRMIEKGQRAKKLGKDNCQVTVDRSIKIDGHRGTRITITHPKQLEGYEFYQAVIFIDDELNLPVGYEGYLWPESDSGQPVLLERYFYSDIKTNLGLKDEDFDPDNPQYNFPRTKIF